ncbi:MAG TPA: hypothetical protein VII98_12720 [Solirubrobacteraceae bacterium]
MGLRDRIFRRAEDPGSSSPAPGTAAPAPDSAVADGEGAATGLWTRSEAQPDDPTVIRPPAGEPDERPTMIGAPAEEPEPLPAAEPAEPGAEAFEQAAEQAPGAPEGFIVDPGAAAAVPRRPGFRERGQLRRRLRFLREVRELGFRDLGGLVFDQHRFQRPNEQLVYGKVEAIDAVDRELRAIEDALRNRTPYDELFIPGVSACQRCGALHGSDARYCPYCGLAFSGPRTLAGMAPDQAAYGTPGAATAPGQAALFDPHTGAPGQQPPALQAQPQPPPGPPQP